MDEPTGAAVLTRDPRPARDHRRRPDRSPLVLLALVLVGITLRGWQWAAGRSLWLDEISIALNLQTKSYVELAGELRGDQVAPLGWLWAERWVFVNVGFDERSLRFLPLLFGCAALVVIAALARRVLTPLAATVAVALAAVSPALIRYSNELKQYSSDTFWVPLLALLTLRCLAAPTSWRTHLAWGVTGAVGLLFSHALLLALAAYGLVLLGVGLRRRSIPALGPVVAAGAVVLAATAVVYVVQLAEASESSTLQDFWIQVGGFPASPLTPGGAARWLAERALVLPGDPFGLRPGFLGLALLVLGGVVLARRRPQALLVLAAPFAVALVAALALAYPVAGRVAVYLVPLALVLAAAAVDVRSPRLRAVAAAALVVVAVPQVIDAGRGIASPTEISEVGGAVRYIAANSRPGDAVFVYYTAGTSALYYAPKVGIPYDGTLYLESSTDPLCAQRPAGPRLEKAPRVWVLFGVRLSDAPADERDVVLTHVAQHGRLVDAHVDTEAAAYLFETGDGAASPLPQRPEADCLVVQPRPPFHPMPR